MAKPKLFVTRALPGNALERLKEYYEVTLWQEYRAPPYEVLLEKAKESDALVTLLTDKIDCKLIESSSKLRIIAQYAVGYDNIDTNCATNHGIYVTNTPGVLTDATADLTWTLILAITRRVVEADRFVRSGEWYKTQTGWHPTMMLGFQVSGATIGIIGMGRIGQAVARRAKGFNMKVIYYDIIRLPEDVESSLGVKYVDLETLLHEADIVTIHTPLTPETENLINEDRFKLMKKTAYLVNTARGRIINIDALYKARHLMCFHKNHSHQTIQY